MTGHLHVVQMSGGIGSWATAHRVIKEHGTDNTVLLFADTLAEHPDLHRFLADASEHLGIPITRVCDGRTPWQVFRDVRRIGNSQVAPCSHILKQIPCRQWMDTNTTPDTATVYVGISWDEIHRLPNIERNWAPWPVRAPLCEPPYVDKDDLITEARNTAIEPPALYAMGFPHNNCGGACVRAGQAQWAHLLDVDPDRYAAEEAEENATRAYLGKDYAVLRDRRGGITKPLPLTVLRHRVTGQDDTEIDRDDWGGCGCFTDLTPPDSSVTPTGEQPEEGDHHVSATTSPVPDGVALLDAVHAALLRYVVLPSPAAVDAVVLWIAASHAQPAWAHAPRLVIRAPERRCGKSRLLDVVEATSHAPLITVNASPAAVYRSITSDPPTLLVDEADTIFGPRAEGANEDLRGLFNAGHQRGRPALRYDAASSSVVTIPTFAMAALAGIGAMPDTIEDRAVVVHMRRRAPGEKTAPYRSRRDRAPLRVLADQLEAWLRADMDTLEAAEPAMPVEDRAADTWEPLVAVADHAGGTWPERARTAAVTMTNEANDSGEMSDRMRLLADCRTAFGDHPELPTAELLARLRADEESPWREVGGSLGLTAIKLGTLLREYGIRSRNIRFRPGQSGQAKGYKRTDFTDAWDRYCPLQAISEQGEPSQPSHPSQARSTLVRLDTWDGSTRPSGEQWDGSTRPSQQPVPGLTCDGTAGTAGTGSPLSTEQGVA
jgi:hypothetical protein